MRYQIAIRSRICWWFWSRYSCADERHRRARRVRQVDDLEDFGAHVERFDPDYVKVLVRCNPDGDDALNARQAQRLERLATWLHARDRKLLFELLVPALPAAATTATTPSCAPSCAPS